MEFRKSKITYLFLLIASGLSIYFWIAVKSGSPLSFDHYMTNFITGIFTEFSYPFFTLMDRIGSKLGIGIVSLLFVLWLWMKKKDYLAMAVFVFAVAFGNAINKMLKNAAGRPRPDLEHLVTVKSLSFPSGHAMMGMILYLMVAYFIINEFESKAVKRVIGIVAGIWILLMGISRVVMQVHYPSDVAAGFAMGFIWVFIWISLYGMLYKGK
ncbi:phosphatase PAP2 family protein [Cytobacillus praedii]|uniref:Phosphatase PAP2 family protein n=1 Tax=Cytobacillus praedii TaxID=1742358 RepID=A0A4R1AY68_9BACI|nr:phosphatase PAP2 family protein [Cytobacillus praedii]MED3551467.1 phosphatase PAP2 family protein [Cytobacillus praedii]TCJ04908.1 phosphatase PAP2 family protein [Cytobacillus praedii]